MGVPFRDFAIGDNPETGDLIVGLRGGVNTQFTWPASAIFEWSIASGATNMLVNNGYAVDGIGTIVLALPATSAQFSIIRVCGTATGLWQITQNINQSIYLGYARTTVSSG